MLIRVLCVDKTRGFVEDHLLEDFIRSGRIVAFFRPGSNEWIDVGRNSIRIGTDIGFSGQDRRAKSDFSDRYRKM
jgi:hypothetical protein